jgi:hypothetical protein
MMTFFHWLTSEGQDLVWWCSQEECHGGGPRIERQILSVQRKISR